MYQKTTWVDGVSVANAEKLNNMENGIETNSKDIEKLKDVNIIEAAPASTISMSAGMNIISCDSYLHIGNKLSLENGKVKIGNGVNKIKIAGSIFYEGKTSTNTVHLIGLISKNDTGVSIVISYSNGVFGSIPIPEKIIDLK